MSSWPNRIEVGLELSRSVVLFFRSVFRHYRVTQKQQGGYIIDVENPVCENDFPNKEKTSTLGKSHSSSYFRSLPPDSLSHAAWCHQCTRGENSGDSSALHIRRALWGEHQYVTNSLFNLAIKWQLVCTELSMWISFPCSVCVIQRWEWRANPALCSHWASLSSSITAP